MQFWAKRNAPVEIEATDQQECTAIVGKAGRLSVLLHAGDAPRAMVTMHHADGSYSDADFAHHPSAMPMKKLSIAWRDHADQKGILNAELRDGEWHTRVRRPGEEEGTANTYQTAHIPLSVVGQDVTLERIKAERQNAKAKAAR